MNIGATEETWKDDTAPDNPDTVRRYFEALLSLKGKTLDKSGMIEAFEDLRSGNLMPFRTAAEHFHLIDDATKTVYIPLGEGEGLTRQLRFGEHTRKLYRQLGQYAVNVYERQYRELLLSGALEAVDDNSGILLTPDVYSRETGLPLEIAGGAAFIV